MTYLISTRWLSFTLVGLSATIPLVFFFLFDPDFLSVSFPIGLGLVLQAIVGCSSFLLVQSYETKNRSKVTIGYAVFWFSLGCCYLVGKSILLPIFLEVATFATLWIYSGTTFGQKQIQSLSALVLVSGLSVVFLGVWIILPDGNNTGLLFLTLALLLKSGFSGFHIWIPKVNEGGPSHALGSFAGVLEIFPLLLFYRYVLPSQLDLFIYQVLFGMAALGVFFGGVTSFFHKNTKVALAYSSVESINFLWLCLLITGMFQYSPEMEMQSLAQSFRILFFLALLHHSFSKTFQLFSIGILSRRFGSESADALKGVGRYLGFSSLFVGAGTFSFAGIPGTLGFLSEATYFFLNVRILDLPIGKSIFLLPSMILIFFGIVLGGFSHVKLFLSIFLSLPNQNLTSKQIDASEIRWVRLSLFFLAIFIYGFPVFVPYFVRLPMLAPFMDPGLTKWFETVSILSACTIGFAFLLTALLEKNWKEPKGEHWDCGSAYSSHELSVPNSVFSDPLHHALGRYFINKKGESKFDSGLFSSVRFVFSWILLKWHFRNSQGEEDVSSYLAISSVFLITIFSVMILFDLGNL